MVKGAKQPSKKAAATTPVAGVSRQRKLTNKQAKQVGKAKAKQRPGLMGSFTRTKAVVAIMVQHWRLLGGITVVYLVLTIIFASGISNISASIDNVRDSLDQAKEGNYSQISAAMGAFGTLVGSGGVSASQTASVLQTMLVILESMVIIWALRNILADRIVGIKQAYYSATAQLIPFILVLLVAVVQLIPLSIGTAMVQFLGNLVNGAVLLLVFIIFILLAGWSLRMLSATVFAIYIVTLPDMHPRQALRAAKNLVRFRRLVVIRKLLFLPLFLFIGFGIITIPLIMIAPTVVVPVFYILSAVAIVFAHTYVYHMYREMIDD